MYRMRLLLLAFCVVPMAIAQESLPKADTAKVHPDSFFVAKEKEVWEGLKNKDKAAAARLLADDFVGMYDFGYFSKPEWIKQIDEQYSIDDYTIGQPKLLRPSPTTSLLLYKSTCKGTGEWAEYCSHTQYISDLWVQRDGKWQALFSQNTQAAPPAASASGSGSAESEKAERSGATEQNDKTLVAKIVGLEKSLWEGAAFPGPRARQPAGQGLGNHQARPPFHYRGRGETIRRRTPLELHDGRSSRQGSQPGRRSFDLSSES